MTLAAEFETRGTIAPPSGPKIKPGSRLVREWHGRTHTVCVTDDGFEFQGNLPIADQDRARHYRRPTLADDQGAMTGAAGGACGRRRDRWRGDGAEQDGRRACRALRSPDDHDLGRRGQQRLHPHYQLPRRRGFTAAKADLAAFRRKNAAAPSDTSSGRALLERMETRDPGMAEMMLAARKGKALSDSDEAGIAEDLADLERLSKKFD